MSNKSAEIIQLFPCPSVEAIDGYGFPSTQLARLAGTEIPLTRIDEEDECSFAVFKTSDIIEALKDHPARLFWQGFLDARQPKSYGQAQHELNDPELSFLIPEDFVPVAGFEAND